MRNLHYPSGPREVFIETTRACNLRCLHCAVSQPHYQAGTLSWEVFSRVLPFLRRHRPLVHLNGHGETLLCKRFLSMFEAIVAAGCRVGFQTNGTLLTPDLTRRLLDIAGPDKFSYVCFSIDAAERELYERIRRDATFDAFCANARFLAEEKSRRGLAHPKVRFEIVAMKMNVHQLPDTVRLVAQLGGSELSVSDLIEYPGMEGQKLGRDLEYARRYFQQAAEKAQEVGIRFWLMPLFNQLLTPSTPGLKGAPIGVTDDATHSAGPPTSAPALSVIPASAPGGVPSVSRGRRMVKACRDPWDVTFVQTSGEVMPCCILPLPMGNLTERTLEEIWRGPQYAAVRRLVASPTPLPDCTTCIMRGWKAASVRWQVRDAVRRVRGRFDSRVHRIFSRPAARMEVRIVPERAAYRPGETCRACLSVTAPGNGAGGLVDVYVAVKVPTGERLWATDRGLKIVPLPFLAAWEPFSFARIDVFERSVPPISSNLQISLLAIAVPSGVSPDDEPNWLASHSSPLAVES